MGVRFFSELPLLRRELTELAQRRRTYVVRVAGAVALTLMALWMVPTSATIMGRRMLPGTPQVMISGAGRGMFYQIVGYLFYAIPILMPALCCTSVTSEKEQNTLGTLLLTRLSPSTILLEKLLSRIVPMLTLLLLVSPVLAYAYSLGGVDTGQLFGAMWLLFVECLLFASLALFCSAWCPTSVSAFVMSYTIAFVLIVFSQQYALTARTPWMFLTAVDYQNRLIGGRFVNPIETTWFFLYVWGVRWPVFLAGMFLLLARMVFVRRAFVGSSSFLLRLFRRLDTFFQNLNAWTTGGIEIASESHVLPDDDPVTWRERNKKSLGQVRWLVRVLLALEGPTFLICCMVVTTEPYRVYVALYPLLVLLWILSVIIAAVKGASLFGQERSRQTLEALLSTSLTTREMLIQKIDGTNRLWLVLACPLATVCATEALVMGQGTESVIRSLGYLLISSAMILLILRTIFWLTAVVGIAVKSGSRAIMISMILVVAWAAIPYAGGIALSGLLYTQDISRGGFEPFSHELTLLSPAGAIYNCELFLAADQARVDQWGYPRRASQTASEMLAVNMILGLVVHVFVLFAVRWIALKVAPRLLNRYDKPAMRPTESVPAEPASAEYHYA